MRSVLERRKERRRKRKKIGVREGLLGGEKVIKQRRERTEKWKGRKKGKEKRKEKQSRELERRKMERREENNIREKKK